jgi:hypothetical protein
MSSCLDKVIKLSRTECECFDSNKPADYNEGQSEVYLDELEGLNLKTIGDVANCEEGNIWEIMERARTNATLAFKSDLLSCIEDNFVPTRPVYSGLIGQVTHNATLNITKAKAGYIIKPHRIVGGKLTIRRIGLIMNTSVAIQVQVYDNDQYSNSPIAQYTINSVANDVAYATLATPLSLPLWSQNVTDIRYYLVYSIAGFQPRNNGPGCIPCSGGTRTVQYKDWMTVNGIIGDGTDYPSFTETTELNGIVLDGQLECDGSRVICSDEYPLDFNTGKAMQMAYAIRFKAGALLIDEILSSPEINRYTMMDREALYGKRNHYRKQYEDWITYLCSNTPIINNDCWRCKPSDMFRRGTIMK